MITKIKKGDRFICVKDVVMSSGYLAYRRGIEYKSEQKGCITNERGQKDHYWIDGNFNEANSFFITAKQNELLNASDQDTNLEQFKESLKEDELYDLVDRGAQHEQLEEEPDLIDAVIQARDRELPPYYDNSNGSLYKIAEQRGWNTYQFEIVKRIDRALKKGEFKSDLLKTKAVIDLWLSESSGKLTSQVEILNK